MDVKNQEKRQIRTLIEKYIEMYVEGIPKEKEDIKKALPRILIAISKAVGLCFLGSIFGQKTLAFSAIPLGTALLCSQKKRKRDMPKQLRRWKRAFCPTWTLSMRITLPKSLPATRWTACTATA